MVLDDRFKISLILSFFSITSPFLSIFFNSEAALIFPIYSVKMAIIFYIIFFIFPICLIFLFFKLFFYSQKNYINVFYFLFSLTNIKYIDYFISYKLNYINDYLILRYCIIIALSLLITFWLKKKEIVNYLNDFFKIFLLLFLILSIFFIYKNFQLFDYKLAIKNAENNIKIKKKYIDNEISHIFILTFEKLPKLLFYNDKNKLNKKFKNLNKFNFINLNNLKTSSYRTTNALTNLYSGEIVEGGINKDDKNKNSIFKFFKKNNFNIIFLNDYLIYPCKIINVHCRKTLISEKNYKNKIFISNWIYQVLNIYIPRSVFEKIKLDSLSNLNFTSVHQQTQYGRKAFYEKQLDLIKEDVRNYATYKTAFVMHSFLTDGYDGTVNYNKKFKNEDYYLKYYKKKNLEKFDKFIGDLINILTENMIIDNSLIFISSDTGSVTNIVNMNKLENNPLITDILGLVYFKNQKKDLNQLIFQTDIKKIIENIYYGKNILNGIYNINKDLNFVTNKGKFILKDNVWKKNN